MEKNHNLGICSLSFAEHKKIVKQLGDFWLSKADEVKPYHHPLFTFLFSDFSFALYEGSAPNRKIVSYLYATYKKNKGFIHIIATKPFAYRHGYASVLLRHLEKVARQKKIKALWAYMLPENTVSAQFFKKHGFIMRKEIEISTDEKRTLYKKIL